MREPIAVPARPDSVDRPASDLPLVVDLDGTLIRTDLLHETASAFVSRYPWRTPQLIGWLSAGKTRLKTELADRHVLEPHSLPYHEELLEFLAAERRRGRRVVLATASLHSQADEIAAHLRLFDEVIASTATVNLRADAKRAALVERFGEGGFEYVGNHDDDRAVWSVAAGAYVVSGDQGLIRQVANVRRVFRPRTQSRPRALARAMRPHQWVKNLLIFLPLLAAQQLSDPTAVLHSLLAFVAFSLTASSVYLFNDIADVTNDRHHPTKRRRPFAVGDLDLMTGWIAWPLLLVVSFAIAVLFLPGYFTLALLSYLVLTVAYTVDLKRRLIVDAITLALLYTARIIAGAAATAISPSFWLLTFSTFFFLSLAFVKRVSELSRVRREASSTTLRGRGYVHEDLELLSSFGVTAGYAAIVVLALYVNDERTYALYDTPEILWALVPLMLFWVSRAWLVAHRGNMNEDPIIYAVRDRVSILVGVAVLLVLVCARFVNL